MSVQGALRNKVRAFIINRQQHADPRLAPWQTSANASSAGWRSCCNICGWHGDEFVGGYHSEGALCPHCGSIARDRFLYWCWTNRMGYARNHRVLETSPRLGQDYRDIMRERVDYVCSDYDGSAHRAEIKLDIQDMDLPDNSIDVILTPHVLEHVPDTKKALSEVFRVLRPGGRMFLQIPMPQGVTAPPTKPEYHGDRTLVYWRFGWDLREMLESAGLEVTTLVTEALGTRVREGRLDSGYGGEDCDEVSLLTHADLSTFTPVASERDARRYGFLPDFMFITWDARKPL